MKLKDLTEQWLIREHFFNIYKVETEGSSGWNKGEVYLPAPQDQTERLPKVVLQNAIDAAVNMYEMDLGARIRYVEQHEEHHPYDMDLYNHYVYTKLRFYPVVRIRELQLVYGKDGQVIWDIPQEAIQTNRDRNDKFGIVNVLPQWGTHETMDPAYAALFPAAISAGYAPNMVRVLYDYGMDGSGEHLDPFLVRAIGLSASLHPFNILGDIVLGAGIASISGGVDGVNMSVNTTSSAENSAYSARIRMYERELLGAQGVEGAISKLRKEWRRPALGLL